MSAAAHHYLLPDGAGLAAAQALLAGHLRLDADPTESVSCTWYDTFDGRLHARGLQLVAQDGRLLLLDAAGVQVAAGPPPAPGAPAPAEHLMADDLPAGRLRDAVAPLIAMRALTAIARTRSRRRALRVTDDEAKTVVRLVAEEPSVLAGGGPPRRLAGRLTVAGVRGYDRALAAARAAIEDGAGLRAAPESLADEAVRAGGGVPGGVSSKLRVALDPSERADAAAVRLLAPLVTVIRLNLPGTLADVDTEFLHDLRVAVRRTRSAQRQLRHVFPAGELDAHRRAFRRLQQVTGPSRDLDVSLLDFDHLVGGLPGSAPADIEPLRGVLADRREAERTRMVRALRAPATAAALDGWEALLERLVHAPEDDRRDAARPIVAVAGRRIAKVHGRMVRDGRRIDATSPPEALHELRKSGKELRYLLEFFASLFPPEVVKPMVRGLKDLQDTLGRHQDRDVQVAMLRGLAGDVSAAPSGTAALIAMGSLIDRLAHEQVLARAEFAERFAAFCERAPRSLVRRTFR
ncbi:CHAD domain-containing protein [Baekduia soli]|uniref:CHAD domain-containing protein n=1 Tax=Baekduia soli TaxID=496014 RepID=A0A5B8U1W7_9ACTN|nr:CHAD domain-containing protein [Baekduia soli]QEC46932.1 CHAD domain-containing protein [Baekduia soli]